MRHRSRVLSWFLSVAMALSLVSPAAAAAVPSPGVSAGFSGDVTLSEGGGGYEASLSVGLDGLAGFTGYELVVDWESLANYASSVDCGASMSVIKAGGFPEVYEAHDQVGQLASYQRYLLWYGKKTVTELEDVATVDFKLDGGIPAGKYPVSVTVIDVIDGDAKPLLVREDPSTYLRATGVLTVRNADGTLPDEPAGDVAYRISSSVGSAAGTGSVTFDKTEAKAGETVTVTLEPATGHELDGISATDTTNSVPVELAKASETEYTFTMPAGDVQVNVSYKLSETTPDGYAIRIGAAVNGDMHANGVESAEAGEAVTVFVKPDEGYETVSVKATAETGVDVTVSRGDGQVGGYDEYTFTMPESAVTIDAVFRSTSGSNKDEVSAGHILVKGTVLTGNGSPLAGAKVQLAYKTGSESQVAAEAVTGADGKFELDEVSGSYTYTLWASYDTGILKGKPADPGFVVSSKSTNISRSAGNVDDKGEVSVQTLTVTLCYEWDVDNDGSVERIFAGGDDEFLTTDDFYQKTVGGKTVEVYADGNGSIQSEKAYYLWDVDEDGTKEKVYVGGGYKAGTDNDYYMSDVDHDPKTADIEVYIGGDGTPSTSDDTYTLDVNNDKKSETVSAGTDGLIATKDDWYVSEGETVYAGEDGIAGTSDDWFLGNADGHDEAEAVFAGKDRLLHTEDDYYKRDVDGDGTPEDIFAGVDKLFNTADDYYVGEAGSKPVKVHPGTGGNEADPYEFGRTNDHYGWTVGGKDVDVRVGTDVTAGTDDDEFGWTVKDGEGADVAATVKAGPDGVPGTSEDYYMYDADGDGQEEKVIAGSDGIPGTKDDYYVKDVNKDGGNETVVAGEDAAFGTPDDHYDAEVKTPDGGKKTVPVYAGEDGRFSEPGAPGSDDWYPWDTDKDGRTEPDVYGNDITDKVFIDGNSLAGTDDYHLADPDKDGTDDKVYVGPDKVPGTSDDFYKKDVDKDGQDETIHVGGDGIPGTSDDFYEKDVDKDGKAEAIHVGEDGLPGTPDGFYGKDADGDGQDETVHVGQDGIPGTPDDFYVKDVDKDGQDETVEAGGDGKFGTEDDHYQKDVDGDGTPEDVKAGPDGKFGTEDDHYQKDVDGDGTPEDVKAGEDGKFGTGDDHYQKDIDGDGTDEDVKAGEDGKFGTGDDHYQKDIDGDGTPEDVEAGEDGKFGTGDDHYQKDIDGDGTPEDVKAGSDGKFGTEDDHYRKDIDGDGAEDELRAGADGKFGTADDEYDKDVDNDGEKETMYVGADTKPNTGDDWYYPVITFDAGAGTVNGSGSYAVIASEIKALPSASRSSYNFNGWTTGGSALTLEQVLALRADTTLRASYSYDAPSYSGGGGGGGGGGGTTITDPDVPLGSLLVTFDTAGGSVVEAQTVESGKKAVKPAAPTRYGFTFTGWYADAARTKAFGFDTPIKEDTTLYAGWELSGDNAVFQYLTREHIAYINGFDDGLVHAGESMTRAQAAQVFYNLLNAEAKARYKTDGNGFTDVDSGAWYAGAVSTLANMGILNGYGDGRFGPEDTMTRAQFAAICVRIAGLAPSGNNRFSDVSKDHWAYGSVCAAADAGLINGYGNGRFGPDDQITRAQVVSLLNRVLNRSAKAGSFDGLKNSAGFRTWPDNADPSAWYYYDVIEAGNGHSCSYDAAGTETWTGLKAG